MGRGKRYNGEPKLNIKKVIIVPVIIAVIILVIFAIKKLIMSETSNSLVSTTYFVIYENNKWGVIDNNAKVIIEPTYEEPIIIPDNKKDIFICYYDINEKTLEYKTKILNKNNQEIFTQYEIVEPLENYDADNNIWYEDGALLIKESNKYGLINFEGKKILNSEYDKIYTLKGIKGSIVVEKEGKLGIVNNLGIIQVENKYQEIKSLGKDTKLYIVKENDKYGISSILDCKYEEIKQLDSKEYFCVKTDNNYKLIDKEEKEILTEKFEEIISVKDNNIVYKYQDKYYIYDILNNVKSEKGYTELRNTANNYFIAKEDAKYGIVDEKGETKLDFVYNNINFYAEAKVYELEGENNNNTLLNRNLKEIFTGIISEVNKTYIKVWTENGYKYFNTDGEEKPTSKVLTNNNLFLSKQNNKYGFVDQSGKVVVDYIYDDAREQNDYGYAAVKKNGLWGSIDKNGNIICETQYNLDNNVLIDFISKYHIGIDTNFIYYEK